MSGGSGFDPSREWLGIDAVDLADPFRALGLSATEADAAAVTAAAERLLARLLNVDPGPFRLAHEALQRRIDACRTEALAVVVARPRPGGPGPRAAFVPPPPPPGFTGAPAAAPSVAPCAAQPPSPLLAVPEVRQVPDKGPVPSRMSADGTEPTEEFRLRRVVHRPRRSASAAPAVLSLALVTAAGAAAYTFWPQGGTTVATHPRQAAVVVHRSAAMPRTAPVESKPHATRQATPRETPPPRIDKPVLPTSQTETLAPPAPPPVVPVPFASPSNTPEPPQPIAETRDSAAAAVKKALGDAYAALRRGEFDAADRQAAAAARLAEQDDDLASRVTCWRQLAMYARQGAALRDQALQSASGDYDVGLTRIAVIESTPQVFKYRIKGETRRVPPADVPAPIVTAIMRAWFRGADQPGNHVFLGVHLLLGNPPDPTAAGGEWALAKKRGQNVSNLEPLLVDPIIRAAATD